MRILSSSFLLLVFLIAIMSGGCRMRGTVVTDADYEQIPVDTAFSDIYDFSSVDTSESAVFRTVSLSEDMERRASKALQPVYFEYDSYTLTDDALKSLANVVTFLNENSSVRILIEGHCDERGTSNYNMGLGENRARVVRNYLHSLGVRPIRLEITSYGKESPARPGCGADEECHFFNRRAEFRVLSQ
ncbi:Peptidoglycan-associated lipoprotein [Chitinispirillum alkaliphilum]|nr:Peptidoglycan-associated lipoprotein [Chitinispirillum alkaliphilum]